MKLINAWNRAAEAWSAHIIEASLVSFAMLLCVVVVWYLVRRRVSSHTGFALFLLPLLPLVVPRTNAFVVHVPTGEPITRVVSLREAVSPVMPQVDQELGREAPGAAASAGSAEASAADAPAYDLGAAPTPTPSISAWLFLGWLSIVVALLARFALVQWRTQRFVREAAALSARDLERVRGLLRPRLARPGFEYVVRFVESGSVTSPAAWGVRRPTIVLPHGLVQRLDDEALSWMLLHEVAHLERRDMLVAGLQRVVQILWFFNPVVWIVDRTLDELRECACDEAALVRLPTSKRRHLAEALLDVAAGSTSPPAPRLALQTLQKASYLMKKRILRMIDPNTPARAGLALGAVPMILALGSLPFVSLSFEAASPPQDSGELIRAEIVDELEQIEEVSVEDAEAQLALTRSLDYLLAWQRPEGHWPMGPGTEEDAGEFNVVGVTGWVVLAMLEAERDTGDPKFRAAIEKAMGYLEECVDMETGIFGGPKGHRYMASHAVATRAWILAHGGQPEGTWRVQAERAVLTIVKARNPYGAWRFNHLPDGDNDAFTTSLMLMALKSAERAGLEVEEEAWRGARMYFDEVYDPATGRTGYNDVGSRPPRLAGRAEDYPAKYSEMVTAIVICARMDMGETPVKSDPIRRGAALLSDVAPAWNRERGTIDYYSWLFGSQALARLGGYQFDHWRAKLIEALVENQRVDEEGRVWWPAVDAWHGKRATVHSTVMMTMALQAVLD
jgi:beta-lactamase regulating signal transducer with metallopeptidase domain